MGVTFSDEESEVSNTEQQGVEEGIPAFQKQFASPQKGLSIVKP